MPREVAKSPKRLSCMSERELAKFSRVGDLSFPTFVGISAMAHCVIAVDTAAEHHDTKLMAFKTTAGVSTCVSA